MEIFYPNKLTEEEVINLSGWKLKVSVLHFGKGRGDCIYLQYGYSLIEECYLDECGNYIKEKCIHVVAEGDTNYKRPVSLRNEINWNNPLDLLIETDFDIDNHLIEYVKSCVSDEMLELVKSDN